MNLRIKLHKLYQPLYPTAIHSSLPISTPLAATDIDAMTEDLSISSSSVFEPTESSE